MAIIEKCGVCDREIYNEEKKDVRLLNLQSRNLQKKLFKSEETNTINNMIVCKKCAEKICKLPEQTKSFIRILNKA